MKLKESTLSATKKVLKERRESQLFLEGLTKTEVEQRLIEEGFMDSVKGLGKKALGGLRKVTGRAGKEQVEIFTDYGKTLPKRLMSLETEEDFAETFPMLQRHILKKFNPSFFEPELDSALKSDTDVQDAVGSASKLVQQALGELMERFPQRKGDIAKLFDAMQEFTRVRAKRYPVSENTIKTTLKVLNERKKKLNEGRIRGFDFLGVMVGNIPSEAGRREALEDFNFLKSQDPQPGTYNTNNGSIVAIPSSGVNNAMVYVYDARTADTRSVSHDEAIRSLEDAGYKRNTKLYVPFSN